MLKVMLLCSRKLTKFVEAYAWKRLGLKRAKSSDIFLLNKKYLKITRIRVLGVRGWVWKWTRWTEIFSMLV